MKRLLIILAVLPLLFGCKSTNSSIKLYTPEYEKGLEEGIAGNRKDAIKWFEKAAAKSDSEAMFTLGLMYQMDKKYYKARKWYKRASALGNNLATAELGNMYYSKKNYKKANKWYKKLPDEWQKIGEI